MSRLDELLTRTDVSNGDFLAALCELAGIHPTGTWKVAETESPEIESEMGFCRAFFCDDLYAHFHVGYSDDVPKEAPFIRIREFSKKNVEQREWESIPIPEQYLYAT